MYSNTLALFKSALVGMHPQFKQMPPSASRSTTAVFKPNCDARMAVTYPPGPLPRTITSYFMPRRYCLEAFNYLRIFPKESTKGTQR